MLLWPPPPTVTSQRGRYVATIVRNVTNLRASYLHCRRSKPDWGKSEWLKNNNNKTKHKKKNKPTTTTKNTPKTHTHTHTHIHARARSNMRTSWHVHTYVITQTSIYQYTHTLSACDLESGRSGFDSRLGRREFSGSSHTSDLKIGTPVKAPGVKGSALGLAGPGVSVLWLGEVDSLTRNSRLSVAARTIVWADPSLRCTNMLLGR